MRINIITPVALAIAIFAGNAHPIIAAPKPQYKTFLEWCNNQNGISTDAKHTVKKLLEKVESSDCQEGSDRLLALQELDLNYSEIVDLQPLAGSTKLQRLYLYNNRITDIKPLARLINLTDLNLSKNQINTIQPLSKLINH